MVRGQIGQHGDPGAPAHGQKLERAQLHHRPVLRPDIIRLAEEWVTDVAPQVDLVSGGLEESGDDGCGGGLPVAAGDGQDRTGTHLEEYLHLRSDHAAPGPGRLQIPGVQAGSAEDHILIQPLQIVLPQPEGAPRRLQLMGHRAQSGPVLFVAGRDAHPRLQQQAQQRLVAHADADDRHALPLKGVQIVL